MKIKSIRMKNYKVFRESDLYFGDKSVILFGVNGVGKSTVLSAISYIFRVFLNQLNPIQSKAFEKFQDEMVSFGYQNLEIEAQVSLIEDYRLQRYYKIAARNNRAAEATYPKTDYMVFKERFRDIYLESEDIGMPIFTYYGTNRAVLDVPDRIRGKHQFDKLSAIERAIDQKMDFRTFFEWFRDREAEEVLKIKETLSYEYSDPALNCVRKAIESMIGDVSGLQIKRNPTRMVVEKNGKELRVDMLSDGEKCTLALLGDLARRLILANPNSKNPLEGTGIVLIDEIELHMHPTWQRRILKVLRDVFPKIQFIITTHSPQVLGEVNESYSIFSLNLDEEGNATVTSGIRRMDGFDSNLILEEYMGTSSESTIKKNLVHEINEAITKSDFTFAEKLLSKLKDLAGEEDAEYILAKGFLMRRRRL